MVDEHGPPPAVVSKGQGPNSLVTLYCFRLLKYCEPLRPTHTSFTSTPSAFSSRARASVCGENTKIRQFHIRLDPLPLAAGTRLCCAAG
jgi:hypothetical protein